MNKFMSFAALLSLALASMSAYAAWTGPTACNSANCVLGNQNAVKVHAEQHIRGLVQTQCSVNRCPDADDHSPVVVLVRVSVDRCTTIDYGVRVTWEYNDASPDVSEIIISRPSVITGSAVDRDCPPGIRPDSGDEIL